MNKFRYISTCIIVLLVPLQANTLLNNAVDSAIKNNPKILIEELNVKAVERDLDQAYGKLYPKIDFNIDYGKRNEVDIPNRGNSKKTDYKGYTSEINLTQNLFNGFADSTTIDINKNNIKNKLISKEIAIDDITLNVVNSFINIVKYRKLIKIQTETLKEYGKYIDIAFKNSYSTGKQTEYLVVTSKFEKINSDLIENKWLLRKYQEQFKQLTGMNLSEDAEINQLSFITKINFNEAMKLLDTQKNTLLEAKSNIDLQKHEIDLAKSELFPKVDLILSSSKGNDLEKFETAYKENKGMLYLKYNIFNGMIDRYNIERKKINHLQAKSNYENILIELQEKITVLYELYSSSNERLQRLTNYVNGQNKLVNMYQIEFETGKRTIANLVDTIQDVNDAKITYTNVYFELINSTYSFAYELGILNNEIKSNNFVAIHNATKKIDN